MCTAATYQTSDFYFGRTLDYESSYGEEIVILPRKYKLPFLHMGVSEQHYAIIGTAHIANGYPLFYDAVNEKGLCMAGLNREAWAGKDEPELGMLRYFTVRLLHELLSMPTESEPDIYFTRSQIAIVKDAEALILSDLSKRITAKELADRFGVSESSFKFYVKGILGESYLSYFRKKRMEKAAELLESTTMKVIEVANAVGYENQGKFAKVFAETYGVPPLEFRRLSK